MRNALRVEVIREVRILAIPVFGAAPAIAKIVAPSVTASASAVSGSLIWPPASMR
jgi:hypothetical protein